jgi:hypothetical protein
VDLSTLHRVPVTWLQQHGGETIRLRILQELYPAAPPGTEVAQAAVERSKAVAVIAKKQHADGSWGGNLLGLAPSVRDGIRDIGTIAQYRRLLQMGLPLTARPFKLADRLLYRLLSRDEDASLLFEYQKLAKEARGSVEWLRDHLREAASCALAEAGNGEDPRLRGAAHRVATAVSQFLRSPLADHPFARSGGATILNPGAHPPTWYSLAMVAAMPGLQRERAGFVERLGQYLAVSASRRAYVIPVGKKSLKPSHVLLGDPMHADSKGNVPDLPLALLFIELLARIGAVGGSVSAQRVLSRLYGECDESGVWRPKKLMAHPRAVKPVSYHAYPLQPDTRSVESRAADVTFRLAIIARLIGRPLEFV